MFHQTITKHSTHHNTNISINRKTHNIQGYNITLTTTQVQETIKQSKNNYSQGPDKLHITHLNHIGPPERAFFTSMLKTALITNIIPHMWNLANIVPIPNTSTHHGYKTQHSTVTVHTLNNTVAKGFNQMAPPERTITVALDMSKAFDTINIHTLISKLLQTRIPDTIIQFMANCIMRRKAYTTQRNHTLNVNSKLVFHKVASFYQHYSTFTLQTYHYPEHRFRPWPTQMTSPSHIHTQARVQINTYNHTIPYHSCLIYQYMIY